MDILLWLVVAITQALVAFLGILAINSEFAKEHFKTIAIVFVALTVIGIIASGWSYARASKYSEVVSQLTKQILFEVRGSPDSYLEIRPDFQDSENGVAGFQFYNGSGYPMIDTTVHVNGTLGVEFPRYDRRIGDVLHEHGGKLPSLTIQFSKDKDNRIDFAIDSRSVTVFEHLYVTWNGKSWVSDLSLRQRVGEEGEEVQIRTLRKGFPFINKNTPLHEPDFVIPEEGKMDKKE